MYKLCLLTNVCVRVCVCVCVCVCVFVFFYMCMGMLLALCARRPIAGSPGCCPAGCSAVAARASLSGSCAGPFWVSYVKVVLATRACHVRGAGGSVAGLEFSLGMLRRFLCRRLA